MNNPYSESWPEQVVCATVPAVNLAEVEVFLSDLSGSHFQAVETPVVSATNTIERSFMLRGDGCFRKEHLVNFDLSIELKDFTNKIESRCWSRGMLWASYMSSHVSQVWIHWPVGVGTIDFQQRE